MTFQKDKKENIISKEEENIPEENSDDSEEGIELFIK